MARRKRPRTRTLLRLAAKELSRQRDPFSDSWLGRNHVSLHECLDLSEAMAVILTGYLGLSKEMQTEVRFRGAASLAGLKKRFVDYAMLEHRKHHLLRQLDGLNL